LKEDTVVELASVEREIRRRICEDIDWMNPYWLDEVKEDFPEVTESVIEDIYYRTLTEKVERMAGNELEGIISEQKALTDSNQNFLLQEIIEEKLKHSI
jgi:hypothetical protein